MFGWEFPPHHSGGLGVACEGLVKGMLHHGMRVSLVLPMAVEDMQAIDGNAHMGGGQTIIPVPSLLQPYDTMSRYARRAANTPSGLLDLYGPTMGEAVHKYSEQSVAVTAHLEP